MKARSAPGRHHQSDTVGGNASSGAEPVRDPDVLTTEQLAARLGVNIKTIRSMAASGDIPAAQLGKNWRYSYRAVLTVLFGPATQTLGAATPLIGTVPGTRGERDPDIVTTEELARQWGVTSRTVRNMITVSGLPAFRVGRDWRYSYRAAMAWLQDPTGQSPETTESSEVTEVGSADRRQCPTCGQPLPGDHTAPAPDRSA